MSASTTSSSITTIRTQVLKNGYTPLPNVDKMCVLKGWPTVEVTEAEIKRWGRMRAYEATGLRIENGLCAIDLDLDIPEFDELAEILLNLLPPSPHETILFRKGKGHKEAWFLRVDEPFGRIAGPLFGDEEQGHRIEIFGGASPRQFGAIGWHTKGELEYQWVDEDDPTNTPLDKLAVVDKDTLFAIVDAVTQFMTDKGYPLYSHEGEGESDPEHVYDLVPEMEFVTKQYGTMTLEQLYGIAREGGNCSASFCDGDVAKNTNRCLISLDHTGRVSIWDSMTCITHHDSEAAPVDLGEQMQRASDLLIGAGDFAGDPDEPPREEYFPERNVNWIVTGNGAVAQNEENALMSLEESMLWRDIIRYNTMDMSPWIMGEKPEGYRSGPSNYPRKFVDGDIRDIQRWLQRFGGLTGLASLSQTKAMSATVTFAEQNKFHPVRDYLNSVAWDGKERLSGMLEAYFGTRPQSEASTAYVRTAGRKWMISAVARAMVNGCKADHVMILQGAQGTGKSTAVNTLAGEWFGDDMPSIRHMKEAKHYLGGKWIIEMAELSSMGGAVLEDTKNFLSNSSDYFRPPYGISYIDVPRSCVFMGTTNAEKYLLDKTGNRRFWPIATHEIQIDYLIRDRDQLWAEAVAAYRSGESWHIAEADDALIAEGMLAAQRDAELDDPDQEAIGNWLRGLPDKKYVTMRDVVNGALRDQHEHKRPVPKALVHAVTGIIQNVGWVKHGVFQGTTKYRRGPMADPYEQPDPAGLSARQKKMLSLG